MKYQKTIGMVFIITSWTILFILALNIWANLQPIYPLYGFSKEWNWLIIENAILEAYASLFLLLIGLGLTYIERESLKK